MKRILLVEDDMVIVDLIKMVLSPNGYDIIHTADGSEAHNVAKKVEPDLILLDVMLPGLDGYTIQTQLAQDENLRQVPVIVITAKGQLEEIFKQNPNFAGFIKKPFSVKDLITFVEETINKWAK